MIASKSPSYKPSRVSPQYVEESNEFLRLFPHRFDYLWAEHPNPGDRPDWHTENRHPLSDRLILQGSCLYGVRFGSQTSYIMLDIDKGSTHHPSRNPHAIGRIVAELESVGLVSYVTVSSSDSGGIHLYFPWGAGEESPALWAEMAESVESSTHPPTHSPSEPLACWAVAQAVESCLLSAGIKLIKGHLELFPNPKRWGDTTAYNGHRLPLQAGSYLLDEEFQPVFSTRERFVERWRFAAGRNWINRQLVEQAIANQPRPWKKLGRSAQKFLNDLNTEIQAGWSGHGQTNSLLGKLVLREYIFGHLFTGQRLRGFDLASRVLSLVWQLPGFKDHCRHLVEIAKRVDEWVRCVESCPRYHPYGGKEVLQVDVESKPPTENERRALDAQGRISEAIKVLIREKRLPEDTVDRIEAINGYLKGAGMKGVSCTTLYKYSHLWHPAHIAGSPESNQEKGLHIACEDSGVSRSPEFNQEEDLQAIGAISLYAPSPDPQGGGAYGKEAVGGSGGLSTAPNPPSGIEFVKQKLAEIRQRTAQQQVKRWQERAETPPDENWFAQMRLSLEVVSDG